LCHIIVLYLQSYLADCEKTEVWIHQGLQQGKQLILNHSKLREHCTGFPLGLEMDLHVLLDHFRDQWASKPK